MIDLEIANLWQRIAKLDIGEVFERPDAPIRGRFDFDRYAQPGYVGRNYVRGGVLLIGQNPGNGSNSMQAEGDNCQELALAKFRTASAEQLSKAMVELMQRLEQGVMPTWSIVRNVVSPLLTALDLRLDQVAYTNLVKFRTSDLKVRLPEVRKSQQHTLLQIGLLEPRLIIRLGKTAFGAFKIRYAGQTASDFVTRVRGDRYLPPAGYDDIARIALRWKQLELGD
ncbi:MAG: hypothetical protein ACLPN5_21020 [Roseiarcus sp.]